MSNWKIGIYLRLSSEDVDKEESDSIINQRNLIMLMKMYIVIFLYSLEKN